MADIPSHHLTYGLTTDFISGEAIPDTDDERYRQKLARLLVEKKGFSKDAIEPRLKIETLFAGNFVVSQLDFVVSVEGRRFMVIRYGPGSLVTRERPAVAAARVLGPDWQLPFAVVTNGEDAELLDAATGKVLATGLEGIPTREAAEALFARTAFRPIPGEPQHERELRILNSFDIEICCVGGPCALPNAPEG